MDKPLTEMDALIKKFRLVPHPEGGFYKEVHRSDVIISSPICNSDRNALTHIYFLLGRNQVSRFHRVVHDEIWNFYAGAPLKLILFDNAPPTERIIGPGPSGFAAVVPGGAFQAAESTGDYTLVGCSVAPGFDFEDFSFLTDHPEAMKQFKPFSSTYSRFL